MDDHKKERSKPQMGMEMSTNMVGLCTSSGPICIMGYENKASAAASRPVICRTRAIDLASLLSRTLASLFLHDLQQPFLVLGTRKAVKSSWPALGGVQHGRSNLHTLSLHAELRAVKA